MLEKIKKWYPKLWTREMVREAVERGVISEDEYFEITGEEYVI